MWRVRMIFLFILSIVSLVIGLTLAWSRFLAGG